MAVLCLAGMGRALLALLYRTGRYGNKMTIKKDMLADTFALITFSLVAGMVIEIWIAGLSLEQSLVSRLLSIPVNLLIARPYGLYRDWVMSRAPFAGGPLGNTVLDIIAYVSFQLPVYALLVASAGASAEQLILACAMQVGGFVFLARPYGLYLQLCRSWVQGRACHA